VARSTASPPWPRMETAAARGARELRTPWRRWPSGRPDSRDPPRSCAARRGDLRVARPPPTAWSSITHHRPEMRRRTRAKNSTCMTSAGRNIARRRKRRRARERRAEAGERAGGGRAGGGSGRRRRGRCFTKGLGFFCRSVSPASSANQSGPRLGQPSEPPQLLKRPATPRSSAALAGSLPGRGWAPRPAALWGGAAAGPAFFRGGGARPARPGIACLRGGGRSERSPGAEEAGSEGRGSAAGWQPAPASHPSGRPGSKPAARRGPRGSQAWPWPRASGLP
jgi:hypothetical protein